MSVGCATHIARTQTPIRSQCVYVNVGFDQASRLTVYTEHDMTEQRPNPSISHFSYSSNAVLTIAQLSGY
jgi:hypothetical protein